MGRLLIDKRIRSSSLKALCKYTRAIIFRKNIILLYVCVTVQCESTNKTSKPTPSRMLPMRCLKKWILEYLIKNVGTKSAKFFFQEEILIWYYLKWCSFSIANLKLIKYIHPEKSNSSYKTFILYIWSFCFCRLKFCNSFIDDKFLESAIYDQSQDVSNRQCYTKDWCSPEKN